MGRTIEQQLDTRELRRLRTEHKFLVRIEKREEEAAKLIGELCREGTPVFYTTCGRYREGSRVDLIAYLIRNDYA